MSCPDCTRVTNIILCIIDEVNKLFDTSTNTSFQIIEGIGYALIENVISKYCVPGYIIIDQDSAFMSSLMNVLVQETST